MPTYIILMKLTDEGVKAIKEAPQRIEEGIKAQEAMGGKLIGFYLVMGEYDYVGIGEAPNDETATRFALALGSQGYLRTTTLKAFPREEIAGIIKGIP